MWHASDNARTPGEGTYATQVARGRDGRDRRWRPAPRSADAKPRPQDRLNAYTAVVDGQGLATIAEAGFDVGEGARQVAGGTEVDLIMTADQRAKLADAGVNATLTRVEGGQTVQQFAARMAANGFNVWRSYDEDGGIERPDVRGRAQQPADRGARRSIGRTIQGREILALKLTEDAREVRDGKRPAVLYSSTQHAREWIADRDQPAPDVPLHRQVAGG